MQDINTLQLVPQPDSVRKIGDNVGIPFVGFGTYELEPGNATRRSVATALEAGYRHIDTAPVYGNEKDVGAAIRESGIPREKLFVTTKLWNTDHGSEKTKDALTRSLDDLGTGYVDCYLIHWPEGGKLEETWETMAVLQTNGLCRAIGVSNFSSEQINQLELTTSVSPSVNQIECNLYRYPRELVAFCLSRSIAVVAYSPLSQGIFRAITPISSIARRYGRSVPQVLLRWLLQHELIVIPRSSNPQHISENIDLFGFELSDDDMLSLDSMST